MASVVLLTSCRERRKNSLHDDNRCLWFDTTYYWCWKQLMRRYIIDPIRFRFSFSSTWLILETCTSVNTRFEFKGKSEHWLHKPSYYRLLRTRGSVVGWGTMLRASRSQVRVPMRPLFVFFNSPNPSIRTVTLGSSQPLTEMSTRNLPRGTGWPARMTDNLTAIRENVAASTSHNPMGLHGMLQG
jgi:hypothetical protein